MKERRDSTYFKWGVTALAVIFISILLVVIFTDLPGFFKLVAAADGGRLLGAHIVGAHASDLVAEAALGVANGLTLEQVAHTIHAHPTLAEGLYEAALLAQEA